MSNVADMLKLPTVTLVAIDTACHDLTRLALLDTLERIQFGEVLVFSDRDLDIPGARPMPCDVHSNFEAERFMWYGVQPHLATPHVLYIQWDGWATAPELWSDEFLAYDYVGAPWPWYPNQRVGNGGFSLRSKRLLDVLAQNPDRYPFGKPEDITLCRCHRTALEAKGLRWAPEDVAHRFAFERAEWRTDRYCGWKGFGFHGLWNFPNVLTEDACLARMQRFSPYHFVKDEFQQMIDTARLIGYERMVEYGMRLQAEHV